MLGVYFAPNPWLKHFSIVDEVRLIRRYLKDCRIMRYGRLSESRRLPGYRLSPMENIVA